MKVAIHTISDDNNFGNRLQNFALATYLSKDETNEVITLQDNSESDDNYYSIMNDVNLSRPYLFLTSIKAKLNGVSNQEITKYYRLKRREHVFRGFTKRYVPKLKKGQDEFDLYVIGSDQIWNPNFRKNLERDFLPEISGEKIISFSASIGIENISSQDQKIIAQGVQHISAVSVREYSAKKIVENLTSCKATVHIDPTMLITPEEWHSLAETADKKVKIKNKFLITYFLGEITSKERLYILSYAESIGALVININDVNNSVFSRIGPQEFLWLFEHAEAVFADSYHAAVFSIIFKKYFEIFERHDTFSKMNTRMETLFAHFNIENRIHNLNDNRRKLDLIDYSVIDSILISKRNEAGKWLDNYIS
ncbi:polysaccharide pyruvyl transferase family protein [Weissella soli]|uniref:polysaccharide pyruvyl transferase family protein n=1 Tax=Weissella soli TaxID=155866 RepID=UPI0011BB4CFF|nr:polysaccharide pyruvyl transferase family protein [Weissella soli]QEA35199.1 polysaccharide pyruvyl transferase family protein [Weissella soli]